MKKLHLFPNAITAFGLSCGLLSIFKASSSQLVIDDQSLNVVILLLIFAAIADVIDGAVARLISAESKFGVQFDSLADAVVFGVAPVLIIFKTFVLRPGDELIFLITAGMMIYSLCGVLRLVRFSVEKPLSEKRNFVGLPIPGAAISAVSANLFMMTEECKRIVEINDTTRLIIMSVIMTVLGYFMVGRWRFPSLKNLDFKLPSFFLALITVGFALLLLYGILRHFPITFLLVSWGYLTIAWTLSIIRLIAGKKSKTLEDFEPEAEDL